MALPDKLPSLRDKLKAQAEAEAKKAIEEVIENKEPALVDKKKSDVGKSKLKNN